MTGGVSGLHGQRRQRRGCWAAAVGTRGGRQQRTGWGLASRRVSESGSQRPRFPSVGGGLGHSAPGQACSVCVPGLRIAFSPALCERAHPTVSMATSIPQRGACGGALRKDSGKEQLDPGRGQRPGGRRCSLGPLPPRGDRFWRPQAGARLSPPRPPKVGGRGREAAFTWRHAGARARALRLEELGAPEARGAGGP